MREQIGNFDSALAVAGESPLAAEQFRVGFDELILGFAELLWSWLAVELIEQRFGVERFQVARPTGHE